MVPYEEIPALIRQARVALVASDSEGLGHNSIEPMACGLPVVGVDNGGTTEAVGKDGECGYILPREAAPTEFVDRIHKCMADVEMGHRARVRVKEFFSLDREIEAYRQLYCEMGASKWG